MPMDAKPKQNKRLNKAEMTLIAMYRAGKASIEKLPYEEIVLCAWKEFPEAFSLRNYPDHPDASDVHKPLYSVLIAKGLAVSLGNKVFRLTEAGLLRAERLVGVVSTQYRGVSERLSRPEEMLFQHVLGTRAFENWKKKKDSGALVDYDARLFFQFGTSTSFAERKRRLSTVIATLEKAKKLKFADSEDLLALARVLAKRFSALFQE